MNNSKIFCKKKTLCYLSKVIENQNISMYSRYHITNKQIKALLLQVQWKLLQALKKEYINGLVILNITA